MPIRVDACILGHSKKRLSAALRVENTLARANDAERAIGGGLVSLPLTVGDNFGDLGHFDLKVVFGLLFIIYLLIAVISNFSQFVAKLLHAVKGVL